MIINADDFGYSESVNKAVAACFEKGVINLSCSVDDSAGITPYTASRVRRG